jgi:hypothetical protein
VKISQICTDFYILHNYTPPAQAHGLTLTFKIYTNKDCDEAVGESDMEICSMRYMIETVRSGGDLTKVGGDGKYSKTVVCPDGCVIFELTAKPLGNENFHTGGFWDYPDETQKQ